MLPYRVHQIWQSYKEDYEKDWEEGSIQRKERERNKVIEGWRGRNGYIGRGD